VVTTCPGSMYERQTMKLAAQKGDSLHANLYYLGGNTLGWVTVRRLGRDSMVVQTQGDLYHARVDRRGMIQDVVPLAGTQKFSADRVTRLDLDGAVASFAAREKAAGAMGILSPRDTVRANLGGASMWIDYSRPAKRGRTVFGGVLVPWGQVWRTGANAATQFTTSAPITLAGLKLPAGTYTLWTVPRADRVELIVNKQHGQWGTSYDRAQDLGRAPLDTATNAKPVEEFTISIVPTDKKRGTLSMEWGPFRWTAPIVVL